MTTNQDLLDGEMGTPPPSTVDVDAIIIRQRRFGRLRRAGLAASVGAMALAVVVVLVAVRPGGPSGQVGGPPSPTPSLSPREQEAVRLTATLQQLLARALPGVEFLAPEPDPLAEDPPTEPLVFVDQGTHFLAAAQIRDADGIGAIRVTVGKEDTQFRHERACSTDPDPPDMDVNCEVVSGPGGAPTETISNSSRYSDYAFHAAEIIRSDDNAVHIIIRNNGDGPNSEVYRPAPHLTLEQTIALAQAPELATTLP